MYAARRMAYIMTRALGAAMLALLCSLSLSAQSNEFRVGADISFLPQMEAQKGVVYTDRGVAKSGLQILKDHGYGWVRLRLFNDPKTLPNNLAYTLNAAHVAKSMGFKILLDFHYADDWADPGHQPAPAAWSKLAPKDTAQALFTWTRDVIYTFRKNGVMPEMVQIGNEVSSGMVWPLGKLPENWANFALFLSAGVQGVNAASQGVARPLIMIHIERSGDVAACQWFYDKIAQYKIPYDVIGLSYYPFWHGDLKGLRNTLRFLAHEYRKPIVIVETAVSFTASEEWKGKTPYYPETPAGQKAFLADLVQTVRDTPNGLGGGVFWWEPAADGPIGSRCLFDYEHKALPAMYVFDDEAAK